MERRSSHRVDVVSAIAGKGWHLGQAVEGIDLAALWADWFGPVPRLEKMLQASIVSRELSLELLQGHWLRHRCNSFPTYIGSHFTYVKGIYPAFLFAAANDPQFAHPRILLMDTIEDKGMEVERSQNFQRILADYSSSAKSEHQIIIATSMIAPELNVEQYTVGPFYTHEERTLKVSNSG